MVYQSNSKCVVACDQSLDKVMESLAQGEFENPGLTLYLAVLKIAAKLEKEQEKALLSTNITPKELEEISQYIPARNISLVNEINKYRGRGKKVFVVTGASHLLQFPPPWEDCSIVKEALHKHKFAIITRKDEFTAKLVKRNADLKRFPLKAV